MKPLISIIILSYNRPSLGSFILKSLNYQEVKNFEVILIENGSDHPIPPDAFNDLDYPITVLKLSKTLTNTQLNAALQIASGEILMPFVADDDFFLSCTTKIIEQIFKSNNAVELLSLGTAKLDFVTNTVSSQPENGKFYTGEVFTYPAKECAFGYFSDWGIGEKRANPLPVLGHASATAVTRDLVNRSLTNRGELFFGQFCDICFLSLYLNTKYNHKIDLPLALIGTNHLQDSSVILNYYTDKKNNFEPQGRFKWDKKAEYLKYSPLKGVTFYNYATDNHLQVLKEMGYKVDIPNDLRVDFFVNHLAEILKDDPWNERSEKDFEEGMMHLQEAMIRDNITNRAQIIEHFMQSKKVASQTVNKTVIPSVPQTAPQGDYNFQAIEQILDNIGKEISSNLRINFLKQPKIIA